MKVLVVEDEMLIAFDLADMLAEMDHEVVGPFDNVNAAMNALEASDVDFGILDFNLKAETSEPIADALIERDIPFFFLTSYRRDGLPQKFIMTPLVPKPVTDQLLSKAIQDFGPGQQA